MFDPRRRKHSDRQKWLGEFFASSAITAFAACSTSALSSAASRSTAFE